MATKRKTPPDGDQTPETRMSRITLKQGQWRDLRVLAALEDTSTPKYIDKLLADAVTRAVRARADRQVLTSGGEV
jgi:hypothetical protein